MSLVTVSLGEASVLVPRQPKEMISVTPLAGKTLVRINFSSWSVIQECLRKAHYLLDQKWKTQNESPATIFGSAIHAAMEVYYAAPIEARELPTFEQMESLVYQPKETDNLILKATQSFISKAQPLSGLPDGDKRSIINGVWILHQYFKAYINDPYSCYVDELGPFVERKFSHRIHEDDQLIIELFGTIDFVFAVKDGTLIPGDHKTTSALNFQGESYFDREKPNHQYTAYLLAAREVFGLDVSDFMVNVIEVKAKPKTARGSAPNFPRQITRRDEDDFAELKEVIMKTVRDYLYAKEHNEWPLGPVNSCNMYGSCTYKQVCAAPKSLRHNILSAKFTKEDTQQGSNNDNTSGHQAV